MGVVHVGIIRVGVFFGGSFPDENCPVGIIRVTVFWVGVSMLPRRGATGKIEPSKQFLLEEKLTFQKKISGVIFEHDIPKELIINLDQTPLS